VLVLGGAAPLVLLVLMVLLLPESVRYMVAKGQPGERIRAVLSRISATVANARSFIMTEAKLAAEGKSGLGVVFSRSYAVGSSMMWLAYFMGLVIFYALINWMPILFKDAGLEPNDATLISALFPLGGCGAIFFGWLMDRFNANRIIAAGYALTAVSIYAIGQVAGNVGMLVLGVRRWDDHEYGTVVHACCTGRRFLSDAGPRYRRGVDARDWSLRRYCRILSRGRAGTPSARFQRNLHDRRRPRRDRSGRAAHQRACAP
jgi:hypothetical protein